MAAVDLNSDLARASARIPSGFDNEVIAHVSLVNAAGYHAGDPLVMKDRCRSQGAGASPSAHTRASPI